MLYTIPSPSSKMTVFPTGGSAWTANMLGHLYKIHIFCREPSPWWSLFIGSCGVVTDQTINTGLVTKIKVSIFPTITYMTACAPGPVATDVHSVIVYGQAPFAKVNSIFVTHCIWRRTSPVPVGCVQYGFPLFLMTG